MSSACGQMWPSSIELSWDPFAFTEMADVWSCSICPGVSPQPPAHFCFSPVSVAMRVYIYIYMHKCIDTYIYTCRHTYLYFFSDTAECHDAWSHARHMLATELPHSQDAVLTGIFPC